MNNAQKSYQAHIENWDDRLDEANQRLFHIKNKDCITYQLTKKTLDNLSPFTIDKSNWLTIGDYNGLEANYLLNNGQNAKASDITDTFLKLALEEDLINDLDAVNVEKVQFPENSFDYVMCKEAFHHFPKAFLGLYEMIRCAKKAAIIIEPIDILGKMPLLLFMKNLMDRFDPMLINKFWKNRFSFETVGNYVFKISERDIEKIAMGMGLPCIAFKRFNLLLNVNVESEILNQTPLNRKYWDKIMSKTKLLNILSYLHILPYNHLVCVVFKSMPKENVINEMESHGYSILTLPENPYL